jgi:phospholipid-binding lipoprotein MlaA
MNRIVAACLLSVLLSACATTGPTASQEPNVDPFEKVNRGVYAFNDFLDTMFLRPVTKAYVAVAPAPVQKGVSNFFGNIGDGYSLINDALQGKGQKFNDDLGRVFVNTIFGFGGIFDLGTELGYERGDEDFGQTLGHYGMRPGPYLMLPLLGPSTVRDGAGLLPTFFLDPTAKLVSSSAGKNALRGVRAVDARAGLLSTEGLLQSAALDKYTFIRSAYLQRRQSLVFDGKPPKDE